MFLTSIYVTVEICYLVCDPYKDQRGNFKFRSFSFLEKKFEYLIHLGTLLKLW